MNRKLLTISIITALLFSCGQADEKHPKKNVMEKEMNESMAKMHAAAQTGNADHDFAAMMIPHHEGAVEMARELMKSNHSAALDAFAKKIVATQEKEIKMLQDFLKTAGQSPSPNAEAFRKAMNNTMMPMMESMHHEKLTGKTDVDFIKLMIPHHQSAVEMAKAYLPFAKDSALKNMAEEIIKTQLKEIEWLTSQAI